jgi:hypothetical protein
MTKKRKIVLIVVGIVVILAITMFLYFALNNARVTTADMKRISQIAQMQTMLELYKDDVGKYPESYDFQTPLSYDGFTYIERPIPGEYLRYKGLGVCPTNFVSLYNSIDSGNSYEILFCVDFDTWCISAGQHKLTPTIGIMQLKKCETKN